MQDTEYDDFENVLYKVEFSETTIFSVRNLKYMCKIAEVYPYFEFVQPFVAQILWGHNIILNSKYFF